MRMGYIKSMKDVEGISVSFSNRSGGLIVYDINFNDLLGNKFVYTAKTKRFSDETPEQAMRRHYVQLRSNDRMPEVFRSVVWNETKDFSDVQFHLISVFDKRDYGYNVRKTVEVANQAERVRIWYNHFFKPTTGRTVINIHRGGNGRPNKYL
jgi:hypothetical protein